MPGMKPRSPIDQYVGSRVRQARMTAGLSQEKLGALLNVTFQQVQKYEKGVNRVSAGTLQVLCVQFGVDASWFLPNSEHGTTNGKMTEADSFAATMDGQRVIHAFTKIKCPDVRRGLTQAIEAVAKAVAAA